METIYIKSGNDSDQFGIDAANYMTIEREKKTKISFPSKKNFLPFDKRLDIDLLKLVEQHKVLYDPSHAKHLDLDSREAVWQEIGAVLNKPAMEFAAIQCQIHFGDFNEEKHKPGLIENLNEYLPEQYSGVWGAEKKILKLYRKHTGLAPLEAKHLYNKTARDLPTYGVTFFVVKEKQKGKKKMVPRLLGINSESILRLDEVTKEILQVWPLTHVKSYHAGTEAFTLNFGDYSDKEYCVKTHDAYRIRDILEGYIDIIRKRLCGPSSCHAADFGAVGQETVETGRANMMTHVVHSSNKVVEQSFVGPSKILPFEQGSKGSAGTQVMTVQQVIVTNKGSTTQQVMSGEVPLRSDMSQELVKKLNRMNSNAVKIVTLLTEPNEGDVQQARSIIAAMDQGMPFIMDGVKEAAEKQKTEEEKKKLLHQLEELNALVLSASEKVKHDNMNPEEVQDQARQIADLTTQMYFALDSKTRRRSDFLRRSRQSFIEDEKSMKSIRRASFIAASATASHAVDSAMAILLEGYSGAPLSTREVEQLEASAVDKLGKLNAAVALFLNAHADMKNVDYDAAVNSMNTIKELLPELATDARNISHSKGGDAGKELMDEVKALTDAARRVCQLTGCDDHQKIQDAAVAYGDVSGRLVYILGSRNPRINADKENQLMDLAKEVGDATTILLVKANELTQQCTEPAASEIDTAGVTCADAARDLLACAQLSSPTIREPHCQSALLASIEGLSASAQRLALTWRPEVEDPNRKQIGEDLTTCTMELAKALDTLKNGFGDLEAMDVVEEEQPNPEQARRLRFVTNFGTATHALKDAQDQLNKPISPASLSDEKQNALQDRISQKLAQTNAAVASLLQAKSDSQNPDYDTAELAINTITEVTADVVKDARELLSSCGSDRGRQAMLADFRKWFAAVNDVCAASVEDNQNLDEPAQRFAEASKKLSFAFSPLARKAREQLMMELFGSAHKQALQMVDDSNKMAECMGGPAGAELRTLGQDVHNSAAQLKNTLMVTAPTLDSDRCRSALLTSSATLSAAARRLADRTEGLQDHETGCRVLSAQLQAHRAHIVEHADSLQKALEAIRHTLEDDTAVTEQVESPKQKLQRLKFITSTSAVRERAREAEQLLEKPVTNVKLNKLQAKKVEDKRAQDLAAVNAAIARLINAKNNRNNPNYGAAEEAMETVSELMPGIVNDTVALSSACASETERAAMLADMRAWCDAITAVCARAPDTQLTEFVESAQHFADTSDKLNFVFNPRKVTPKEQQVLQLSRSACSTAHKMAADAARAAAPLPALPAAAVRVRSQALHDAASALHTTAQLTAPNISELQSRAALLATTECVSETADDLVTHTSQHSDPDCRRLGVQLMQQKVLLEEALGGIKHSCNTDGTDAVETPTKKAQRLKFISSVSAVHAKLNSADNLLDQPTAGIKLSDPQARDVREKLSQDVARVHAAVSDLLQAKSDAQNPDYVLADRAIETISELVPTVAKETMALSTTCTDEAARATMVKDMRAWCDGIKAVCSAVENDQPQELKEAVEKLSSSSGKMKFIISCRKNPMKEHEVIQSARAVVDQALQMSAEAALVSQSVRNGGALSHQAEALKQHAEALITAVMLLAPSIHEETSRSAIISAAESLNSAAATLVAEAKETNHPDAKILGAGLQASQEKLTAAITELKDVTMNQKVSPALLESQQLKFTTSAKAAEAKVAEAKKLLDQPSSSEVQLKEQGSKHVQDKLLKAMGQVNAALASLLNARADPHHQNYAVAEQSCATISELLPEIINDAKDLNCCISDSATQAAALTELRAWCDAIQAVCASAASHDAKVLNDSTLKFCDATQKLHFVNSARRDMNKEQLIGQLTNSACDKAKQMVLETRMFANNMSAPRPALLARADELSDAAAALRTTQQLVSSSIHEEHCVSALLSSADRLSASAALLVGEAARTEHPEARRLSEEASRYRDLLDQALGKLRQATVRDTSKRPPPPPVRSSASRRSGLGSAPPPPAQPQPPRVRVVSHSNGRRASQEWLNHMREDASKELEATLPPGHLTSQDIAALNKKAEDERQKKEKFQDVVAKAEEDINKAEVDLNKICHAKPSKEPVDDEQTEALERQVESKLAQAGTAAARLVASSHPDVIDFATATQATETLSELIPDIIKDAAQLSHSRDEPARKALLDHIRALSAATRRLLTSARNDNSSVTEAAVEFGDKSAGLLYAVAAHVDPAQEKGVISRAREIGDLSSSLAGAAAALAARGGAHAQPVCDAGRHAAEAAGTLVYTAKLVAPTVHNQQCQNALITASHELSSQMKTFSASWKPLSSDPECSKTVAHMNEEVKNLEKLLESFRHDLASGTLVKKREVEKIVIEDTELRQLASQIMEMAQMRARCGNTADDKKKAFNEYAGTLRAAIRALDVAASRRTHRPQDLTRYQDLEAAVQNLQICLLQSRPTLGDQPQNNVVDLTDFVKATSSEAEKLITTANKTKVKEDKKEVESIKAECHAINVGAFKLLSPDERGDADDAYLDGLLDVEQFGQDCENRVQTIKTTIEGMKQKEVKDVLFNSSVPLVESCYYLRFATKSALATAQSASLDETIDDLNEFEKRLNKMLLPSDSSLPGKKSVVSLALSSARARLVTAVAGLPRAAPLTPALTAYVTEIRSATDLHDPQQRNRVKEHLSKVLEILKQLTATCSVRVASWQPVACAQVTTLTDSLIQELENPPIGDVTDAKQQVKVLKEVDINRLLMPADVKIEGEPKKIEEKLQQTASKLVMLSDTLSQSAVRPESLARTAPAAADAAMQLAAAARSLPELSLAHAKRTEEAAQEMCWATYNLLKTAELVTRDPTRSDARAQLRAASRKLTDAINKLARSACSGNKLGAQCGELTRALQAQLVTSSPAPAQPYAHCLQELANQRAMIDQLNNDDPMSREQFGKSLDHVTSAVCNSTDYAAQCAYLITLSEKHKDLAMEGLVDVPRLNKLTSSMQEHCYQIMRTNQVEMAKEEEAKVSKLNQELQQAVKEASTKIKDAATKRELTETVFKVDLAAKNLNTAVQDTKPSMDKISGHTLSLVESVCSLSQAVQRGTLLPSAGEVSQQTKEKADEVVAQSKSLISKTAALVKAVKSADDEEDPMTWVTYNTQRKSVVEAFEALLSCLKRNGEQVGFVEKEPEEEPEVRQWSYVRLQEETARKWLHRRPSAAGIQDSGVEAARVIVDIATQMAEDLKGSEREDTMLLITESNELIADCSKKYDNDKASALMDRLRELRRLVERGAVTCVVEDILHADAPLQDFEIFVDAEKDEAKRKLLLEKKIAELMSQLGRVTRTARLVSRAGLATQDIAQCCQQTELLAPQLVQAAQARVSSPDDETVVAAYRQLLAQYAAQLTLVRELSEQAVDPLQFVRTAGETMSRMREESSQLNDPRLCAYTSNAITRLANRVIVVSMSSHVARSDPELRAALAEAQDKLSASTPAPGTRQSRLPDWKDTTAEILRTTGEVESALGGENIFKKLPDSDQPIYNAALSLHSAVRGWSARDNEIVAVAKRMAVLMARLSEQMTTERKRELIITSKAIVTESREVAALARKLAHECSDVRIKTNLLQVCERIPTISGQLKMLTTVKGSTLGNQGGEEDREAMNMLVTNAQNLMSSVQEVVKAAASASVKIASQRGLKWVRKNY